MRDMEYVFGIAILIMVMLLGILIGFSAGVQYQKSKEPHLNIDVPGLRLERK